MRVVISDTRCGITVTWGNRIPFDSLSLAKPPDHGTVVLGRTGFYYTPAAGFAGSDEFSVDTWPSGKVRMRVTVLPPEAL